MLNIPPILQATLIAGSLLYLGLILLLLKKNRLNVQYSIIWLASAAVFLILSLFPILVAMATGLFKIEMPANLIFALLFIFILLLLLSLSCIVTKLSASAKRLAQHQALLEERLRRLEERDTEVSKVKD